MQLPYNGSKMPLPDTTGYQVKKKSTKPSIVTPVQVVGKWGSIASQTLETLALILPASTLPPVYLCTGLLTSRLPRLTILLHRY